MLHRVGKLLLSHAPKLVNIKFVKEYVFTILVPELDSFLDLHTSQQVGVILFQVLTIWVITN